MHAEGLRFDSRNHSEYVPGIREGRDVAPISIVDKSYPRTTVDVLDKKKMERPVLVIDKCRILVRLHLQRDCLLYLRR